jgi:hypothetical protein
MRRPGWTLKIAGFAAAGCALAVAASFLIPDTYTSSAVLRFTQPQLPEDPSAPQPITPTGERMQQMQREVLGYSSLEGIIRRLDLYGIVGGPGASVRGETVEKLRNPIRIQMLTPPGAPNEASTFRILFSDRDPKKAQAVIRALIMGFLEWNVRAEEARARESGNEKMLEIVEYKAELNLGVLDPASLPEKPVTPNRLMIAAAGLALGFLLGGLTLWFRQNRGQTLRAWIRNLRRGRFGAGSVGVKSRLKAGCSQNWLPHLGK